jgi:hypothetical protein
MNWRECGWKWSRRNFKVLSSYFPEENEENNKRGPAFRIINVLGKIRTGHLPETCCAVAKLVEALRYKPEGRGFDSRRGHWIFFF